MSLQERFERFHEKNPHVFAALKKLALEDVRYRGRRMCAIDMYVAVLRWMHPDVKTTGDQFKINNSYSALYARKLMAEVPELAGKFKTRGTDAA